MGVESLSDVELVERVRGCDRAAADELGRRCLAKLRKARWLVGFCPRSQDRHAFVEDVITLAAEKIFKSLHSFQANFDCWVGVVARSVAQDHAKHLSRRASHEANEQEPYKVVEARPSGFGDTAVWADASALAHEDELTRVIVTALEAHAQKDEDSAMVVLLTLEHSVPEIAIKRGRSQTTIRSLLVHDYSILRKLLGDRFGIRQSGDILKG